MLVHLLMRKWFVYITDIFYKFDAGARWPNVWKIALDNFPFKYTHAYTFTHTHKYLSIYIYTYIYMCVCVCVCVWAEISYSIYIYIYIYILCELVYVFVCLYSLKLLQVTKNVESKRLSLFTNQSIFSLWYCLVFVIVFYLTVNVCEPWMQSLYLFKCFLLDLRSDY